MRRSQLLKVGSWGIVVLGGLLAPAQARAQATIPAPGVAVASLTFQRYIGGDHVFSTDAIDGQSTRGYVAEGNRWYLGDTRANVFYASLDLGLSKTLGVTLGTAAVQSAYFGYAPVDPEVDDGIYHTTLQDGVVVFRRPFRTSQFIVTPSLGATFPLRDYAHEGHAAPGRGFVEVKPGLHAMMGLGPYSSTGFVAVDVGYGWVTNVSSPSLTRLTTILRAGYYRSRRLTLYGFGSLLETFGGLEWASADSSQGTAHGGPGGPTLHTQASAAREAAAGIGFEWALSGRTGMYAGIQKTIWGENVEDAVVLNGGLHWAFRMFGSRAESRLEPK